MISLKKIRVVHYVESWLPQTSTWLYNNIRFLPEDSENFIVCQDIRNINEFQIPNIYSLESLPKWQHLWGKIYFRSLKYLTKLQSRSFSILRLKRHLRLLDDVVQSVKPDILHSHFGHLGWVNSKCARKHGLKHIVSFYGADINFIPYTDHTWLRRYQEMSNMVDQVLCEGPFMAQSIVALGIPLQKITIYRLGIDLNKIRFEPRRHQRGEKLRFLIVGSFREKKGIPYALDALGLFQRINKNIEITIIGDAGHQQREKDEKEKIFGKIRQWNLTNKVRFLGYQSHDILLNEAYQHHIFISPSVTSVDGDSEGGAPVTIIEMAASGMPVVSTNHCDIPFVLSERTKDYLVDERDSQALCKAINLLIESDWEELALSNRRFIEQHLDVRKQARKLHEIYLTILNS